LSFPILKEPLRALLLVLAGLAGGLVFYPISGYSEVLGILGAMFVTLVGHTLLQMVYEVDFGAVFKKLPGLILSLILVPASMMIRGIREKRKTWTGVGLYYALMMLSAFFGSFPVPFMGYGASPILGYFIVICLL
jgi:predicted membrane protein